MVNYFYGDDSILHLQSPLKIEKLIWRSMLDLHLSGEIAAEDSNLKTGLDVI